MPREIWNEGRVVGLSAYELYVKQHLAEDPDMPVATEREWLSSSLGMGSSMILKFPNTTTNENEYDDEYIDVPLPVGSKLAAANSIVATFFDGIVSEDNMLDNYFAKRIDSYGTSINNDYSDETVYTIKELASTDVFEALGEEPEDILDIETDIWAKPPVYLKDQYEYRYINLGLDNVYTVGDGVSNTKTIISITGDTEDLTISTESIGDLSSKYMKFTSFGTIYPPELLQSQMTLHFTEEMSTLSNYGFMKFGRCIYVRADVVKFAAVKVSEESGRKIDGKVGTDDITEDIPSYDESVTKEEPGETIGSWMGEKRSQLSDYLKIEDGVVIQPGTWSESEYAPPASDFEVDLAQQPVIRFRVRGKITTNPLILLTGFTVRYVLCGTLGQDTATDTMSPQDGDFLGPATFPWCNKVLFTVPNNYVSIFERNYLNTKIDSNVYNRADISVTTNEIDYKILNNKPVVYFVQNNLNQYDYYTNDVGTDEKLFIQGGRASSYKNRKIYNSSSTLNVSDYSSLNNNQSVFVIYNRNSKFPPSLYSGTISTNGENKFYPVDVSSPGTVKMFHETSYNNITTEYGDREDAPYDVSSEYETYYTGTNSIAKKYNDGTLWTIDNRKVAGTRTYNNSMIPVSKVDNYNVKGYVSKNNTTDVKNPSFKSEQSGGTLKQSNIQYKVSSSGRDSYASYPFGEPYVEDDSKGVRDRPYLVSTKNSPLLEPDIYSDEDMINWYDLTRALAGNRRIDILGPQLREFKNSMADSNISFEVYKFNLLFGNGAQTGSSGTGPGPNDYYVQNTSFSDSRSERWVNESGNNTPSTTDSSKLFTSVKLDIYGYIQNYNNGNKQNISDLTFNYMASISAVCNAHPESETRNFTFAQRSGHFEQQIQGLENSFNTDSGGNPSHRHSVSVGTNVIKYKSISKIGVNSWIQGVRLSDRFNTKILLKLLHNIVPRNYYANRIYDTGEDKGKSFILDDSFDVETALVGNPDNFGIICSLNLDKTTGDVTVGYEKNTKQYIVEGYNDKPAVGTYYIYSKTSDNDDRPAVIRLNIFYDIDDEKYKADVTCIVPDKSVPINTFTFQGRIVSYHNTYGATYGDITCCLDISGLMDNIDKWWGIDLDSATINQSVGSDYINGYIQGKADGKTYWMAMQDTFTTTGGISLTRGKISNYPSKGSIEIDGETIPLRS